MIPMSDINFFQFPGFACSFEGDVSAGFVTPKTCLKGQFTRDDCEKEHCCYTKDEEVSHPDRKSKNCVAIALSTKFNSINPVIFKICRCFQTFFA